jgi:hypothetical protein
MESFVNRQTLPENACFGCGQANAHGLQITVSLDPENPQRLLGNFNPQPHMIGFPAITHGGAIYTAMDCMATWSGMVLRKTKALWLLRSASVKYHRPAIQSQPISLAAVIQQEGGPWEAIEVLVEASNPQGERLVEGLFKVIPVTLVKFKELMGITEIPEDWIRWLNA